MPAGVGIGRYFKFATAAILSMFAGSSCVHYLYKPLDDLPELIEKYYEEHPDAERPKPDVFQQTIELNYGKMVEDRQNAASEKR